MANEMKISMAADFSLLKTNLGAMFVKEGEGMKLLVIPNVEEDAPEVSLGELIADIKKVSGGADTGELEKAIKDTANDNKDGKIDVNSITFSLRMLYLYIDTTKGEKITEYALNIQINTEGLVPQALKDLVDVKRLGIAVWNTSRAKILERMSIVNMDQYLGIETAG